MAGTPGRCAGCGGLFAKIEGPTHAYMLSSPGCWARFGAILAREYSDPALLTTHRLSVDAYAVQHPGDPMDRRAVQSVGLHLCRLMIQLGGLLPSRQTNDVMLQLGPSKASLPYLEPPKVFALTVAEVPTDAAPAEHVAAVRAWADAAWSVWQPHHEFVRKWVSEHRPGKDMHSQFEA